MSSKPAKSSLAGKPPSFKARARTALKHGHGPARRAVKVPAKLVDTAVLPGGYRVYGSALEPVHTTCERIAEVVAAFKQGDR